MDAVDVFSAQWVAERPGLDVGPIEVWGRLKRSAYLFEKVLSDVLDECDLNMAEFEVLSALMRHGAPYELRPTELTRSLIITPGAVTARLATLERRGLIARRSDLHDRRVQLVSLSAKGLRLFEPAFDRIVEACSGILVPLDSGARDALDVSLRALMSSLDSIRGSVDNGMPESP